MPKATLEILDEVNVHIRNIDVATRRRLVKEVSYFVAKARYTELYAAGRWDGRISYCTQGGRTFINLLERLIPIIQEANYDIDIVDQRESFQFEKTVVDANFFADCKWPITHRFADQPIILEDHQVIAANNFFKNAQCLQEISTGAGKTILTAVLAKTAEQYGRTLTIVPNKDLVLQTQSDFALTKLDVGIYYGDAKQLGHQHTVCTWHSLNNLYKQAQEGNGGDALAAITDSVKAVIVDEAHTARSVVLKKLLCGPLAHVPIRWGMTGTVPLDESELTALLSAIGPVIHTITAKELQDNGFLANCHINVAQMRETINFGNYQAELAYLTENETRLQFFSKLVRKIASEGNTLVLVERLVLGQRLKEILGDDTVFIEGKVKSSVRKEHYDQINAMDNRIIIATYGVAAVGINLPRLYNMVLIEPGKSFIRTIQSIGRSLRKAKDKDAAVIWDVASTCKYSGRHLTQRKKYYKQREYPFSIHKVDYQSHMDDNIETLFEKAKSTK